MAEIQTGGKKSSPRVDMTPMVDLGFLLVTFFMVTTTFSKPNVMPLAMPDKTQKKEDNQAVKESQAITVILAENNRVIYYTGLGTDPSKTEVKVAYYNDGAKGIRKALLARKDEVASNPNLTADQRKNMIVLIKPDEKCRYKNVVDMLDEMKICDIKTYAIVNLSDPEKEMVANTKAE